MNNPGLASDFADALFALLDGSLANAQLTMATILFASGTLLVVLGLLLAAEASTAGAGSEKACR